MAMQCGMNNKDIVALKSEMTLKGVLFHLLPSVGWGSVRGSYKLDVFAHSVTRTH